MEAQKALARIRAAWDHTHDGRARIGALCSEIKAALAAVKEEDMTIKETADALRRRAEEAERHLRVSRAFRDVMIEDERAMRAILGKIGRALGMGEAFVDADLVPRVEALVADYDALHAAAQAVMDAPWSPSAGVYAECGSGADGREALVKLSGSLASLTSALSRRSVVPTCPACGVYHRDGPRACVDADPATRDRACQEARGQAKTRDGDENLRGRAQMLLGELYAILPPFLRPYTGPEEDRAVEAIMGALQDGRVATAAETSALALEEAADIAQDCEVILHGLPSGRGVAEWLRGRAVEIRQGAR